MTDGPLPNPAAFPPPDPATRPVPPPSWAARPIPPVGPSHDPGAGIRPQVYPTGAHPARALTYAQGVPPGLSHRWSAPRPVQLTPPPRKRTRRERWELAGSLTLVVVISLVFSALVGWGYRISQATWEHTPYGYDIIERRIVPSGEPFRVLLPVGETWTTTAGGNPWAGVVDIYTDAALTHPYPYFSTRMDDGVRPTAIFTSSHSQQADLSASVADMQDDLVPLGGNESWPTGTYYLVERQNAFGDTLDTPRAHVYTVEAEPGMVTPPDFTMDVVNGVPHFEWTPVENAIEYYIVQLVDQQDGTPFSQHPLPPRTTILGTATGTSWFATDQDMDYRNAHQRSLVVRKVNSDFRAETEDGTPCEAQDITYTGSEPVDFDTSDLVFPSYAVVAIAENGDTSLPIPFDGKELIASTPVATAERTFEAMATAAGTPLFLPGSHPVTMGDCRTAFLPITPTALVSSVDKDTATLQYATQGSPLSGEITSPEGDAPGYARMMDLGNAAGLRVTYQRGAMEDATSMPDDHVAYYAEELSNNGILPTSEVLEAPYAWNGSSEMVRYIAAHLFAGNKAIDMSQFTADPAAPLIYDAASEALLQNPYITDLAPYLGVMNDVLYVDYEMSAEDRAASAARIKARVDEITAAIIPPGTSDHDKALAINDWLARNAVYDDPAAEWSEGDHTREEYAASYPNSWDAEGVLIDGTGVCTSYATAFKALADAAGLPSVTVTGFAGDSVIGHQWVKAFFDGRWQVIDPTWNSGVWEQIGGDTQWYFGLTDAEAERMQFDGFSVDSLIPSFDAV